MKPPLISTEQTKVNKQEQSPAQGIHIVAKPIGPVCNLNCEYCFYLEKQALFETGEHYRMSDHVLSTFITNYIASQPTPVVEFVWQGGEPTLLGIEFFEKAIALQRPFMGLKTISNSIQTNGTLLTDEWCSFLKKNNFMVGISLDGPEEIHDRYRRDRSGKGSFEKGMRGLKLLQKHQVDYNVMACVARDTARHPLDVYRFFKDKGIEFIQFSPIVERMPDAISKKQGLRLAGPAVLDREENQTQVTPWSVVAEDYGDFLITIYEEWVRHDVGKVFVMNFEWALNAWIGNPSPVCIHARQCGRSLVMEHNGDVYACDHCVYPEYRLGNIVADNLGNMADTSRKSGFGVTKETALPRYCRECEVLAACHGGCPKHRFTQSYYGEPGLHYLCAGNQKFFRHIRKYLRVMTTLLENGLPASEVMKAVKGPLVIRCASSKEPPVPPGTGFS
ncbi:MAG: anaerobic sulfatase maturase [Thermodesulfobacteriota bacterium]